MALHPEYVTGFCEGHSTFTYSRSGRQLAMYFGIRGEGLEDLAAFFGVGKIYGGNYYRVTHRDDLAVIVRHFDEYPLRTKKRAAYEIWREMVLAKRAFRSGDREHLERLATQLSAL